MSLNRRNQNPDRLPPHSVEAEAGILGCCLLEARSVAAVQERCQGERVFYDLRHQLIWAGMEELWRGGGFDFITLGQWLRDRGELDQIGGHAYLGALPESVPSAANLPRYLEIVWEKFLARSLLATSTLIASEVLEHNGTNELMLGRVKRLREEFEHKSERGSITPRYLKPPAAFEEGFFATFFGGGTEAPGVELPIPFVLKIRPKETTLVSGDDGSGKSTLLNYFALHLGASTQPEGQGPAKVCIASMEMPPAVTLWILASQLLGAKHLPDTEAGREKAGRALAWLNARFWFYDFLGISDWRDVLDTFRFAAERHGVRTFILDSVMRVGIPDDDYAQQGIAAAAFAQFAKDFESHLFFVIHENKADGKGKAKIRGSKLWSANADNVLRVERNVEKGEKASKLEWEIRNERLKAESDRDEEGIKKAEEQLAMMRKNWDSRMVLQKQRYPGTVQNAGKYFWFDTQSFQFRGNWADTAENWLERWKRGHRREEQNFGQDEQDGNRMENETLL